MCCREIAGIAKSSGLALMLGESLISPCCARTNLGCPDSHTRLSVSPG